MTRGCGYLTLRFIKNPFTLYMFSSLFMSQFSFCVEHEKSLFTEKYKKAIVRIVIRHKEIPVDYGTGIFISNNGKLVTTFRLMQSVIGNRDFSAEFISSQNGVLRTFEIFQCDNQQNNEICLLKLKIKPSSWFNLSSSKLTYDHQLMLLGHTLKEDFVSERTSLLQPGVTSTGFSRLTLSDSAQHFQEGAAILNLQYELVGIKILSKNNFDYSHKEAISLEPLRNFISGENLAYDQLDFYRNQYRLARQEKFMNLKKTYINPAFMKIYGRIDLNTLLSLFHELHFGQTTTYRGYIPKSFFDCITRSDTVLCKDKEYNATFSIHERKVSKGYLSQLEGKATEAPKGLRYVDLLKARNQWSTFESKLTPEQRGFLFSSPNALMCEGVKAVNINMGLHADNSCHQTIYQDGDINTNSYSIFAQKEDRLFTFSIQVSDPMALEYFFQVPPVFFLSLKTTGKR